MLDRKDEPLPLAGAEREGASALGRHCLKCLYAKRIKLGDTHMRTNGYPLVYREHHDYMGWHLIAEGGADASLLYHSKASQVPGKDPLYGPMGHETRAATSASGDQLPGLPETADFGSGETSSASSLKLPRC